MEQAAVIKAVNIIAEPISDNGTCKTDSARHQNRACLPSAIFRCQSGAEKGLFADQQRTNVLHGEIGTNTVNSMARISPIPRCVCGVRGRRLRPASIRCRGGEIIAGTYYIDLYLEVAYSAPRVSVCSKVRISWNPKKFLIIRGIVFQDLRYQHT